MGLDGDLFDGPSVVVACIAGCVGGFEEFFFRTLALRR